MSDELLFVILFSGTWIFVGTVFLIIGLVMLNIRKKKILHCTAQTWGKVKDIVSVSSTDMDGYRSYTLHPIFEYHVGDLEFIQQSSFGKNRLKIAKGQDVEIYYNPEKFDEYYVPEHDGSNLLSIIFTIIGIVAILIGVFTAILVPPHF